MRPARASPCQVLRLEVTPFSFAPRAPSLGQAVAVSEEQSENLLLLDTLLDRLAQLDPQEVRIIELRFFAGLSVKETAEVLEISPTTVKREWSVAKKWLSSELRKAADFKPSK